MDEAVGDGAGGSGVVEELAPILEGEIGGDDGRGTLVALVEDLVEQVGPASVEGEVAELIDDEEVEGGPGGETTTQRVAGLGGDELVDEIGGERETDAVAAEACELAECVGEVGFPDAGGTEKNDVGPLAEEVERCGTHDEIAIDAVRVVEVVTVEGDEREDLASFEAGASTGFELDAKLVAHEMIEECGGSFVAGDGLFEDSIELAGGVIEAERAEDVVE